MELVKEAESYANQGLPWRKNQGGKNLFPILSPGFQQ